jgi:endonuclease/exonuclease/phosphatase family metal-dependent hydrolase
MNSKMKRRVKRIAIGLTIICALIGALFVIVPYATTGASSDSSGDSSLSSIRPALREGNGADSVLPVMTANIAHGRGTGRHQALQSGNTIRSNLDEIAKVLLREQPDVVALQEADGPSFWSGGFSHVEHLADAAGFSHQFRGEHVKGLKTSYGTALLSQVPLNDRGSVTFAPSPPTLSKGYVVGRVGWPGNPGVEVTVVSVHLDFSRASVRKAQVEKMILTLSERERPLIIMGDFNCSWTGKEGSLRTLAEGLEARAYEPAAEKMGTFPSTGKRLDWILISADLEFVRYETIIDAVSDHRAVIASLKLRRDR